jgi:hypothetical protein
VQKFSQVVPHLCGIARSVRDKKPMMIFRAFFDETATNPREDESLIFGGFFGHVAEWERATNAWDKCLKEAPSIDYFSHYEASNLDGQFRRFSHSTAGKKIKNLSRVISNFLLQGVCITVPYWWFANRDQKVTKGMMGARAYDWGFLTATSGVLQMMSKLQREHRVDFIFDQRNELRACINTYDELKERSTALWAAHAGVCLPGNDKEIHALQMADLLAGEFFDSSKAGSPSESYLLMNRARPIAHMPCTPPSALPEVLETQKRGAEIQRSAQRLLKRIYGDKEKSWGLVSDVVELRKEIAFFNLQYQRLCRLKSES